MCCRVRAPLRIFTAGRSVSIFLHPPAALIFFGSERVHFYHSHGRCILSSISERVHCTREGKLLLGLPPLPLLGPLAGYEEAIILLVAPEPAPLDKRCRTTGHTTRKVD